MFQASSSLICHGESTHFSWLRQALMETVNSSSSVLLQKLDLTQQDLLKQSKDGSYKMMFSGWWQTLVEHVFFIMFN
jgi:hypothetical protein